MPLTPSSPALPPPSALSCNLKLEKRDVLLLGVKGRERDLKIISSLFSILERENGAICHVQLLGKEEERRRRRDKTDSLERERERTPTYFLQVFVSKASYSLYQEREEEDGRRKRKSLVAIRDQPEDSDLSLSESFWGTGEEGEEREEEEERSRLLSLVEDYESLFSYRGEEERKRAAVPHNEEEETEQRGKQSNEAEKKREKEEAGRLPLSPFSSSLSSLAEEEERNKRRGEEVTSSLPPPVSPLPLSPPSCSLFPCLSPTSQPPRRRRKLRGTITLVGAGPGAIDHLSLSALRAIRTADLVVADRLLSLSPSLLSLVRGELFLSKKWPGCAAKAQKELDEVSLSAAERGLNVVRLKSGDPFIFGRGGEEVLTYRERGFSPAVIPGLSSSLSAPLLAGIPLTMRGVASQVLVATGHGRDNSLSLSPPQYEEKRTLVMLMAVGRLFSLSESLLSSSYPLSLPVAFIEKASSPQQRVVRTTVGEMVEVGEREKIEAPAVIVIGWVVNVLHQQQ